MTSPSPLDHNLHGSEEGVTQQKVDACRTEKYEQQVGGRAHHAVGRYRQDGKYGDKGRKEVEYYCF